MKKWADFLISEVSYDSEHLIFAAIRHEETESGITSGIPVDRITIASDIKNGLQYFTIFSGNDSWKKGNKITTFSIDGTPYLRIDENKVPLDSLGGLLESSITAPEPIEELEYVPEPTEPQINSKGLLPKESTKESKQELEYQPEPFEPTIPSKGLLPKGMEQVQTTPHKEEKSRKESLEDYENQYMQKLEDQRIEDEKAYQEMLEAEEKLKPKESRGSLPKGFEPEPELETESVPEPEPDKPQTSSKGSLPKGMEQVQQTDSHKEEKSRKEVLEDYENQYMQKLEDQRIEDEKAYQEMLEAEEKLKPKESRGSLPKGFESTPEPKPTPEPEPTPEPKKSRGSLPKGFESIPEPEPTPEPKKSRGSLPKGFESIPEPEPTPPKPQTSSKGLLPKESPKPQTSSKGLLPKESPKPQTSSKGSLPKETVEPSKDEVTPAQIAEVDALQRQIDELEKILSTQPLPESLPEKDDNATTEQISKVAKLEKQIDKLLSKNFEKDIVKSLEKQKKKLDDIEKNLDDSTKKPTKKQTKKPIKKPTKKQTKKSTKKPDTTSNVPEAYCVKCKTKRIIKNPEETKMKNGRDAIKGFCSVCNCKVFRIGKMKK